MKLLLILIPFYLFALQNDFLEVKEEPKQIKIKKQVKKFKNAKLEFLYKFRIKARVVSAKKYNFDSVANIITHDFGVVWGKISKSSVFNKVNWKNEDRLLKFSYTKQLIDSLGEKYMLDHISNIHLIPKNKAIERKLDKIKKGDIVVISGYLVNVNYDFKRDSYQSIKTSITRTDRGIGACEVIFVLDIKKLYD